MHVLITTKPDDGHAFYVERALTLLGHEATLWFTANYPSRQTHSFFFEDDVVSWRSVGLGGPDPTKTIDVVWFRRAALPVLPAYVHEEDRHNAIQENKAFVKSFWPLIAPNALWINPIESFYDASSKLVQLKEAAQLGLKIPLTLVSNDPGQIKHFIASYSPVIYKSLRPMYWCYDDHVRLMYTSDITTAALPSEDMLQATPGIFQRKIEKAYELRVTYFGDTCVAVKIDSQARDDTRLDWRAGQAHGLPLSEVSLPEHIDKACRLLMRRLRLLLGCFDFIVTPDDEYYFLEVNEQGQFLWIEQMNPSIHLLDPFIRFLCRITHEETSAVRYGKKITLAQFDDEVADMKKIAMQAHVKPELMS